MEYPYVVTSSKLRDFLSQLKQVGVPDKVNQKYIESLGYKSKNDRRFPQVLEFLGLIDESGSPTDLYRSTLRGGNRGQGEFARLIRESYADLFATYPDAQRKDNEALQNFFTAHTDLGSKAIQLMTTTFKTLCSFADFDAEVDSVIDESPEPDAAEEDSEQPHDEGNNRVRVSNGAIQPLTINVNIQLELPTTNEAEVYDNLFSSMAKHIMRLSNKE